MSELIWKEDEAKGIIPMLTTSIECLNDATNSIYLAIKSAPSDFDYGTLSSVANSTGPIKGMIRESIGWLQFKIKAFGNLESKNNVDKYFRDDISFSFEHYTNSSKSSFGDGVLECTVGIPSSVNEGEPLAIVILCPGETGCNDQDNWHEQHHLPSSLTKSELKKFNGYVIDIRDSGNEITQERIDELLKHLVSKYPNMNLDEKYITGYSYSSSIVAEIIKENPGEYKGAAVFGMGDGNENTLKEISEAGENFVVYMEEWAVDGIKNFSKIAEKYVDVEIVEDVGHDKVREKAIEGMDEDGNRISDFLERLIFGKENNYINEVENDTITNNDYRIRANSEKNKESTSILNIPLFNQKDYPNTLFGSKTVSDYGCNITCYSMLASYYSGETITPDILLEKNPKFHQYQNDGGAGIEMFTQNPEYLGGTVEVCWWRRCMG